MPNPLKEKLTALAVAATVPADGRRPEDRNDRRAEDGFEVAQSMGIALLGLVIAAAFAGLLRELGVDVVDAIRSEIGL